MTNKAQLQFFQGLLRDAAIHFWQSLNITDNTTLDTVLRAFRKVYRNEKSEEAARIKWDALKYDPTTQSFTDFLHQFRKLAKQAFGNDANVFINKSLYGKLPTTMQHELSLTGQSNATLDDIKEYINRRCQLQIATPTHQVSLVNEVSTNSNTHTESRNSRPQNDNREKPRGKFNGYSD